MINICLKRQIQNMVVNHGHFTKITHIQESKKGSYIIIHLAVDESSKENGGLIYLQGSHAEEILDYQNNKKSWKEDNNEDGITRPGQTINYEQEMLNKYKPIDVFFS